MTRGLAQQLVIVLPGYAGARQVGTVRAAHEARTPNAARSV
jgi:hypothetical protein